MRSLRERHFLGAKDNLRQAFAVAEVVKITPPRSPDVDPAGRVTFAPMSLFEAGRNDESIGHGDKESLLSQPVPPAPPDFVRPFAILNFMCGHSSPKRMAILAPSCSAA